MSQVNKQLLENAFKWWAEAFGFKIGNEAGNIRLESNRRKYAVVQIEGERRAERRLFSNAQYTADDLYNMLDFATNSQYKKEGKYD